MVEEVGTKSGPPILTPGRRRQLRPHTEPTGSPNNLDEPRSREVGEPPIYVWVLGVRLLVGQS